MEQESELQRLEKFVEKILIRFSALKEEKAKLEQEVFDRDLLIEELRENIDQKVSERNNISDRVNKIVGQIEEWELSLENEGETGEGEATEDPAVNEASDSEEVLEELSEEEEKRIQHNLFSMNSSGKE